MKIKKNTRDHDECNAGCFPFTKNFGKFLLGISVWEETLNALVKCSAIFSNMSLFDAFPSNKCLLSACVVMRSLASTCFRRSRFTVIETSPVHEITFQTCSCNKQEFLPTYHF